MTIEVGASSEHTYEALIIGAGFTGLGTAHKLKMAGVRDLVILERADRVGGTWRDNTYPGVACDIPSLLYSFSFAANPDWSRMYPTGAEIHQHIEELSRNLGLEKHLRFGQEVTTMSFDEALGVWDVSTKAGDLYRARSVVVASGPLADASLPAIRGIETFEGRKILSAQWDHDYDLSGRNVAVIGTGASAIQILPAIAKTAASVKVFQRTPGWVMPRLDVPIPGVAKAVFSALPATQLVARNALYLAHEAAATGLVWNGPVTTVLERIGKLHLRLAVKDPWLRRQLTPDFRPGCKRMLMSSEYYPTLQRANTKLITWPIATISPKGLRTSDGIEHDVDCIVFATGYDVHLDGPPYEVRGRDGRSLKDDWAGHAQAYKSVSVHGYPNLFFSCGPNSGPGHNSLLVYVEAQIGYIVRGIKKIIQDDLLSLDVREDVQTRYNARIQERLAKTTWNSGCSSWYLTADGFNAAMFPGFATQYRRQMSTLRLGDYEVTARVARSNVTALTAL